MARLKIADFHEAIGATRREIETWVTRKDQIGLRTSYAETVAGSARRYSRANVLELAGLSAFVRAGLTPMSAVAFAETIVSEDACSKRHREWCVFVAGDLSRAISTNDLNSVRLAELTAKPGQAPVFAVVQTGEIVRRVDALFASETVAA
jgi:hypothetical protein